ISPVRAAPIARAQYVRIRAKGNALGSSSSDEASFQLWVSTAYKALRIAPLLMMSYALAPATCWMFSTASRADASSLLCKYEYSRYIKACSSSPEPSSCCDRVASRAAAIDAKFDAIDSCHIPKRAKMCDGMWRACGEDGAIAA